jgi:hypothetical protein
MMKALLVAWMLVAGILQQAAKDVDIASSLVMDQRWVPYPAYVDRQGWDDFLGEYRAPLIAKGEACLGYQWLDITDDDYLAYDRYDDRHASEDKLEANRDALSYLFIAELAEGEGRFLPDIIQGISWCCQAKSWAVVTHLAKYQKSLSPLPDPNDQIIELQSGNFTQLLSWIHYYLGDALGAQLKANLRAEIYRRTLDPFLQRDDFMWMGFVPRPGKKLNNWNPWCNQNVLLSFMLLENDRETLAKVVEKSLRSVDLWVASLPEDGACDEGTTYWYKSVGHFLSYLEHLGRITGGAVTLWDHPFLKKLGEFIVHADIGDCWQVNFADGTPSRRPISYWIFRYARAIGNPLMRDYAVSSFHHYGNDPADVDWALFYQGLEAIRATREIKALQAPEVKHTPFVYYPQTDICFARSGKGFLAAKGGNNGERHNHNDVGSCIYFFDARPVLVDAGIGHYEKYTFGPYRYIKNWFVKSGWHNLPVVNGCEQPFGEEFTSSGSRACRLWRSYSTDIAGAYPDSAGGLSWKISYRLKRSGGLVIKEKFSLKEASAPTVLQFLVYGQPVLKEAGKIELHSGVVMHYDPVQFQASVEEKSMEGLGFSDRFGKSLYRIKLTATQLKLKGTYRIKLIPLPQESLSQMTKRVVNTARKQFALLSDRLDPASTPRTLRPDGTVKDGSVGSWTSGFFSGSLWMLYKFTGDPGVLEQARKETAKLSHVLEFPLNHDIGFQVNCSYGNAYRITGEDQYLPLIHQAADALAGRFNPTVGATLSWQIGEAGSYPVIIDNMMNLELLTYASRLFHCDTLRQIAVEHAKTTLRNHFRPDGTSWHMLDYDPATGEVLRKVTVQGYADDSAWARGQAWALYGYTMMYRETGLPEFLAQAEAIARMLLQRLPHDGIPYWDFDDPEIPGTYRDASAGAIMCSAFVELSTLAQDKELAKSCRKMAEKQLRTLASPEYLAPAGTNGGFLLLHSVGNLPGGSEVDVPLPYADYYFLEALYRYNTLN